jgi:hypothetical protein
MLNDLDIDSIVTGFNNTYIDTEISDMISYVDSLDADITLKNYIKERIYNNTYVSYEMIHYICDKE